MDTSIEDKAWDGLTHEEKNKILFLKQKELLALLLDHGAISQAQHDKSLHDLTVKMDSQK